MGRSTQGVHWTTWALVAPLAPRNVPCVWFQYTPASARANPQLRPVPKNHSRSFLIGPPRLADSSKSLTVWLDVVRPRAISAESRLEPSKLWLVYWPLMFVRNVLLPSLGTTLTTMPSALVSAEMPLVDITSSSTDAELSW